MLDDEELFEKKGYLLVSWKQVLVLLHKHCLTPGCCALTVPEETIISEQGASVTFRVCCTDNHQNTWHSSEFYPKHTEKGLARAKLNVELSTWILPTGLHFAPIKVC